MSKATPAIERHDRSRTLRQYGRLPELDRESAKVASDLRTIGTKIQSLEEALNTALKVQAKRQRCIQSLNEAARHSEVKVADLIKQLLAACSGEPQSETALTRVKEQLKQLSALRAHTKIVSTAGSLIEATRHPFALDHDGRLQENARLKLSELMATKSGLEQTESTVRADIKSEEQLMARQYLGVLGDDMISSLSALADLSSIDGAQWKVFLSYARPDEQEAWGVWRALGEKGSCFFDQVCLKPGVKWSQALQSALASCDVFVCLITKSTASAHYQISEIQRAINLHRNKGIKILVARQQGVDIPIGLEQFQAVHWSTTGAAAMLVQTALRKMDVTTTSIGA